MPEAVEAVGRIDPEDELLLLEFAGELMRSERHIERWSALKGRACQPVATETILFGFSILLSVHYMSPWFLPLKSHQNVYFSIDNYKPSVYIK